MHVHKNADSAVITLDPNDDADLYDYGARRRTVQSVIVVFDGFHVATIYTTWRGQEQISTSDLHPFSEAAQCFGAYSRLSLAILAEACRLSPSPAEYAERYRLWISGTNEMETAKIAALLQALERA